MVYIKEKSINGKKYYYLAKSLRLPDGKLASIEKSVGLDKIDAKKAFEDHKLFFLEKEKKLFQDFALKNYKADSAFTEDQIRKIEGYKAEFRHLLNEFSPEDRKDLWDRFIANFTYESNAIEGNSLTLKDVAIVIFQNQSIEGKELREIWETKNSRDVMNRLLNGKYRFNEKGIIKLHADIMKNIDSRTGYKQFPNEVIGSRVKRTPPEKVKMEMSGLLEWKVAAVRTTHPLKVAAQLHGKFELIHPFSDGNGRVGRFLALLLLHENGYPPIIIRKSQRHAYYKCLEDFFNGYPQNLERFFLDKYKKTYEKFFQGYKKYILKRE